MYLSHQVSADILIILYSLTIQKFSFYLDRKSLCLRERAVKKIVSKPQKVIFLTRSFNHCKNLLNFNLLKNKSIAIFVKYYEIKTCIVQIFLLYLHHLKQRTFLLSSVG